MTKIDLIASAIITSLIIFIVFTITSNTKKSNLQSLITTDMQNSATSVLQIIEAEVLYLQEIIQQTKNKIYFAVVDIPETSAYSFVELSQESDYFYLKRFDSNKSLIDSIKIIKVTSLEFDDVDEFFRLPVKVRLDSDKERFYQDEAKSFQGFAQKSFFLKNLNTDIYKGYLVNFNFFKNPVGQRPVPPVHQHLPFYNADTQDKNPKFNPRPGGTGTNFEIKISNYSPYISGSTHKGFEIQSYDNTWVYKYLFSDERFDNNGEFSNPPLVIKGTPNTVKLLYVSNLKEMNTHTAPYNAYIVVDLSDSQNREFDVRIDIEKPEGGVLQITAKPGFKNKLEIWWNSSTKNISTNYSASANLIFN